MKKSAFLMVTLILGIIIGLHLHKENLFDYCGKKIVLVEKGYVGNPASIVTPGWVYIGSLQKYQESYLIINRGIFLKPSCQRVLYTICAAPT